MGKIMVQIDTVGDPAEKGRRVEVIDHLLRVILPPSWYRDLYVYVPRGDGNGDSSE